MKKQSNALLILALFLFFPAFASVPTAVAQDEIMEFVMSYERDMGELNPIFTRSARTGWYSMLVYDSLLSCDENLNPTPWLAEAYSVSTDGFEVTFTLREGATWHDGQPVTPEDIKFTCEHIRDGPVDSYGWTFLQHIANVTIDGQDIVFTLDQVVTFAVNILGNMPILPKHIREGITSDNATWDDHTNVTAHTGSGMFKYVERIPGEFTLLERFEDWWGPDNPHVGQLPNIERVRIDVVRGQDARIMAMRNGEADTELYEVFGAYVDTIRNAPELKLVTDVLTQWYYDLGMNTTLPGLDDFEVRKAMAYAINRQELINIGRLGFGVATTSVLPEAYFPRQYHADGDFPEQNTATANQILDDAEWVDTNMNGIRDNGAGVELSYDLWAMSWDDTSVATGTGLKLQLEEIGFEINLVPLDSLLMYPGIYMIPRTFEMYVMGNPFGPYPVHPWWSMHSENTVDWGSNPYGWVNSTFDNIIDDYMAAPPAEFSAAARAVQIAATENMPYIPLFLSEDTHAIRAEWTNFSRKLGGPFTPFAPETMVFMFDSGSGLEPFILGGVGVSVLAVAIVSSYVVLRRRKSRTGIS
ncbi:MAG: ABC transporter substrate-binding protein [Candidatus Thorarchaeota archaeon]|jgi:ABC-type transport system substrate-binding protein